MKKNKDIDLEKLNQSFLSSNQKTINNLSSFTYDKSIDKSEKKLHKTVLKLFGK